VSTGSGPSRVILHGWVCSADNTPCQDDGLVTDQKKRRVLYAAALTWGDDGATPAVPAFLPAAGVAGMGGPARRGVAAQGGPALAER